MSITKLSKSTLTGEKNNSIVEANEDRFELVQYLCLAGGGSSGAGGYGGGYYGGGGGAGGYVSNVPGENSGELSDAQPRLEFKPGTYTVSVGAGGAATNSNGSKGTNSIFMAIQTTGGGAGGAGINGNPQPGFNGGCGGGGGSGNASTTQKPAGLGTANQGFDGGIGTIDTTGYAGTGGGAGAAGTGPHPGNQITGGAGITSSITGSAVTRGTGGGVYTSGLAGSANTGDGGRSTNVLQVGYAGGSGVVIMRFPTKAGSVSVGAGLVSSSATVGLDTVITFTSGEGEITLS